MSRKANFSAKAAGPLNTEAGGGAGWAAGEAKPALRVSGRWVSVGRLRDEWYEFLEEPRAWLGQLPQRKGCPDVFTFVQRPTAEAPEFPFYWEPEALAVLPITNYEQWWKSLKDKTRNRIRKAYKNGLSVAKAPFGEELLRGIKMIYDETPVRQGRAFRHYQKPLEVIQREHSTYLERSEFIGAYVGGELAGFAKLVFQDGWANLMNIIAKVAERDKLPTTALIAKAVERCAEEGVGLLQYGSWSRRSMGEFKVHHRFERLEVPRYYVPLTWKGRCALRLGLHRDLWERLPEAWIDHLAEWRHWYWEYKYRA